MYSESEDVSLQMALSSLQLNSQSSESLKHLLNDDQTLNDKLKNSLVSLENQRNQLIATNRSLAEHNIKHERHLLDDGQTVHQLLQQCDQLSDSIRGHKVALASAAPGVTSDPDTVLKQLNNAADQTEQQSEELVASFLAGSTPLDSFLDQFLPLRTAAVQRRTKADKMREMLANGTVSVQPPPRPPPPTAAHRPIRPAPPVASGLPQLPYPTSPMAMPMPPSS